MSSQEAMAPSISPSYLFFKDFWITTMWRLAYNCVLRKGYALCVVMRMNYESY